MQIRSQPGKAAKIVYSQRIESACGGDVKSVSLPLCERERSNERETEGSARSEKSECVNE